MESVFVVERYSGNLITKIEVFGKYQDAIDHKNELIANHKVASHNILVVTYKVK